MALRLLPLLLVVGSTTALRVGTTPVRSAAPVAPARPTLAAPAQPVAQSAAFAAAVAAMALVEPAGASDVSWIAPTKLVLGPLLSIGTILFLMRVVLSWFPKYDLKELPWSIAAIPTEPLLKPTRAFIPPVAGVDISPLVWVGLLSFISEILLGPQGLLTIMQVCQREVMPSLCCASVLLRRSQCCSEPALCLH